MSSILEALKKLEKEKLHRNEISTAIASDILRSGSKPKPQQWRLPLALFLLAVLVSTGALFLLRTPNSVTQETSGVSVVVIEQPVIVDSVDVSQVVTPVNGLSRDLPLLSGIVYQRRPDARMAILNDLPVMEGTIIAGYTLYEIFPDHVVLTRLDQSFSVYIPSHK